MGSFNFDLNPPIYTDGEYIDGGGGLFHVVGKTRLTTWKKGGQPSKAECASAAEADGQTILNYAKGNRICGRTAEGRVFQLEVTSAGYPLKTRVTVWNK